MTEQEYTQAFQKWHRTLILEVRKWFPCPQTAEDIVQDMWCRLWAIRERVTCNHSLLICIVRGMRGNVAKRDKLRKWLRTEADWHAIPAPVESEQEEKPDPVQRLPKKYRPVLIELLEVARSPHPPARLQDMAEAIGKDRIVFRRLREALAK